MRSREIELAERINMAQGLLKTRLSKEKAAEALMERFGVSKRQAYRYIQASQKTKGKLPLPEEKEVFTVKLPISLVSHLRQYAESTGESLSTLVTQALEALLRRRRHG